MDIQELFATIKQRAKYHLFTIPQKQAFLEDFASLVEDGIQVNRVAEIISKTAGGLVSEVANSVLAKLAEGKQIADGLRGWFPDPIIEVLQTGEEGGTLQQSMRVAAEAVARHSNALAILINTLLYPLIILTLSLFLTVFINHSVFNSFEAIKPIAAWPANGQSAVFFANFIQGWWWMVLILIVAGFWGTFRMLHVYVGEFRVGIDHFPVLSLYRKFSAARFMETLGLLISNGVVFKKALKILQRSANPYLASHLLTMEYRLSGGKENIAEVLDTGLLNKHDLMRLRVIAQGKGIEHALVRSGHKAATDTMEALNIICRMTGALLLVFSAGLAAFLVFAVYSVGATLSGG